MMFEATSLPNDTDLAATWLKNADNQETLMSFQSSHSGTALVIVTCQCCILVGKQRSTASCPDRVH